LSAVETLSRRATTIWASTSCVSYAPISTSSPRAAENTPTRSQQIRIRCQRGDDIIELHGYGLRALDETGTVFGTVPQFFLEP
jgi:hypothetical protein